MKVITPNNLGRPICTTEFQKDNNWIFCDWEGFANLEAIKEWGESFLKVLKETKCSYLLNDDSKSTGPWTSALDWIESYLIPAVIENGLRYYAHVVSESTFSALSANELKMKVGGVLEMNTFTSLDEAKKWLKEKQGA